MVVSLFDKLRELISLTTIINLFTSYGYIIVFFGVMLENAGIPVPGETIVLAAGFFAAQKHFSVPSVILIATIGAIIGDNLGYLAGTRLGRPFALRYGKYFFLTPPRIKASEDFFARHGDKTILIARFVSGLRVFAAFFAGMSHMRWRKFLFYNSAGAVLWATTMTLIGYFFGHAWNLIEHWIKRAGMFFLVIIVLWFAVEMLRKWQQEATDDSAWARRLPAIERREAALVLFNLALIVMFVRMGVAITGEADPGFDYAVTQWMHAHATGWMDALMLTITQLGGFWALLAVGVTLSIFFFRRYGHRREATAMLLAVGLAQGLNTICKYSFHRARPHEWETLIHPHDYSFPSGHAMVSMAVYGSAALLLSYAYPRYRRVFRIVAAVLVLLIGTSRVYLGVHWSSDVLAGFAAGLVVMFVTIWWHSRDLSHFTALATQPETFDNQP